MAFFSTKPFMWFRLHSSFKLQSKITLVLVSVIAPTYLFITILQNKFIRPLMEQELKQLGISSTEAIGAEILRQKLFLHKESSKEIEKLLLQKLYYQPSILRLEVFHKETSEWKLIASSIDEEVSIPIVVPETDIPLSEYVNSDDGLSYWKLWVPIIPNTSHSKKKKVAGMILTYVSTKTISRLVETIWKVSSVGALLSILISILGLNFFLKRTMENEKKLSKIETENLQLSSQLYETQRQLMNLEKLAVIGQLTSQVAHEIGTPLSALQGHLELLKNELTATISPKSQDRIEILLGEVARIEKIVRNILQTSSKPSTQKQLTDIHIILDKTLLLLKPRLDELPLNVERIYDKTLPPLRIVPSDFEQVFLNLFNNAIDSLIEKKKLSKDTPELKIKTAAGRKDGKDFISIQIRDNGIGIKKQNLEELKKPFFTTKPVGQGTGLGLTISNEILSKYSGALEIESKENAWAKMELEIPVKGNL